MFPSDIEYETGVYNVSVTLTAKVSGRVDTTDLGRTFCVDATDVDANGGIKELYIDDSDYPQHFYINDGSGEIIENLVVPSGFSYQNQYISYVSNTFDGSDNSVLRMWVSGSEESAQFVDGREY